MLGGAGQEDPYGRGVFLLSLGHYNFITKLNILCDGQNLSVSTIHSKWIFFVENWHMKCPRIKKNHYGKYARSDKCYV